VNRLALVGLLLAASEAGAQSYDPKLEVDPFVLTSDPQSVALTESARPLARGEYAFGLDLRLGGPALDVCVKSTAGACTTEGNLVGTRFASDLGFALGFGRVGLHAQLPIILHQSSDFDPAMGGSKLSSAGVGDARIGAKVRIAGGGAAVLGLDVTGALPTGGGANFIGDGGTTIESKLLLDLGRGPLVFAANAGYAWRQHASRLSNLYVDDELVWSAAAEYRARKASFGVALFGRIGVVDDPMPPAMAASGNEEKPIELLASARFRLGPAWALEAGAGAGLTEGYGAPPFRALLGLRYVHRKDAVRLPDPELPPPPPPAPKDSDGDGLLDTVDKCPMEPEDKDGFGDDDGCPDPDNDGDGVADVTDKCPLDPEDKDGFEDEDGCPELDNDQDGIADAADKCPMQAEDKDGFEDDDGCPEDDNDKDGIVDANDKCPLEAEIYNGVDDQDGCPDKGKELVQVTSTAFEIKDSIFFDTNKATIKRRSFKLLDVIAGAIQASSGVRVRVEGHTDDTGTDEWNQSLSEKRAAAVMAYLVKKGVDAARLESAGFGKSRPKVEGKGEKVRAQNRRVEFVIVK
jgi:outer membrane protein OmpA-like peptidoglycan-associated protein